MNNKFYDESKPISNAKHEYQGDFLLLSSLLPNKNKDKRDKEREGRRGVIEERAKEYTVYIFMYLNLIIIFLVLHIT